MGNNILDVALKEQKFKEAYDFGIKNGLIKHFDENFINEMKYIYINFINCSLYDYFKNGDNVGFCLDACNHISEMFDEYEIYKGFLPAIRETKHSPNGEHAWIISDGMIYDTSLLLIIDKKFSEKLGYEPHGLVNKKTIGKTNSNHS